MVLILQWKAIEWLIVLTIKSQLFAAYEKQDSQANSDRDWIQNIPGKQNAEAEAPPFLFNNANFKSKLFWRCMNCTAYW